MGFGFVKFWWNASAGMNLLRIHWQHPFLGTSFGEWNLETGNNERRITREAWSLTRKIFSVFDHCFQIQKNWHEKWECFLSWCLQGENRKTEIGSRKEEQTEHGMSYLWSWVFCCTGSLAEVAVSTEFCGACQKSVGGWNACPSRSCLSMRTLL